MRNLLWVLLLIIALPVEATYWVPANQGMTAWSFTDIVINPTNPQVIYAVGMTGVYKSSNGGTSWTAANNGLAATPYTYDVEMHPSDPNTLYVVSQFSEGGRGIYKSTDGGTTWVRKSNGIYLPYVNSVTVFKTNPEVLFCGTNVGGAKGGVFKSTNGGESWTLVAGDDIPGSGIGNDAAPIVVDPFDSNYVYCGRNSYTGFLRSIDSGAHWTWQDNSFVITDIVIHPVDTNRIFAGGTGYLKMSTNRGQSLVGTGIKQSVGAVTVAPSNPDIIYAGLIGGPVYKSTDCGDTWSAVGTEAHQFRGLAVHPTDPSLLCAVTDGEGILKSTNGGMTWSPINSGLPNQMRCTKMVTSRKYKAVWAILDTRAIYASFDDANSWIQLAGISGYPTDFEISGADDKTLFMVNSDVYKSIDLGFTWIPMNAAPSGHTIGQIAVDPQNPNVMFISDSTDYTIRRSTDGGSTWQIVFTVPANPVWGHRTVTDIAIDPSNSQRIYLGTYNYPWKSEDSGNTWTKLSNLEYTVIYNNQPKLTSFVRDIAIDPVQPNIVYATTQWGWTWKSTDYGDTWTRLNGFAFDANVHQNVVFDPRDHNTIYIATLNFGIYKSTNGGASFIQLIDGLTAPDTNIYVVAISPWNYDHILGGSYSQGVYRGGGSPSIPNLSKAKGYVPDGGVFCFTDPMVVSARMPDGSIYVQAEDRSHGIRVTGTDGFRPGDLVKIKGFMGTASGERYIKAFEVSRTGTTDPPAPIGLPNRAIGGASLGPEYPGIAGASGVNNTGLLVQTWGRVTAIADSTHFYIDDGSAIENGTGWTGVCVELPPNAAMPQQGDYTIVQGISGTTTMGSQVVRMIRVPIAE